MPEEIYVQLGENRIGTEICLRKWSEKPFEDGTKYVRAPIPAPVERIDHLKTALMNAVTPFYEEDKAEWVLYCGGKESAVAILQAARAYLQLQGGSNEDTR